MTVLEIQHRTRVTTHNAIWGLAPWGIRRGGLQPPWPESSPFLFLPWGVLGGGRICARARMCASAFFPARRMARKGPISGASVGGLPVAYMQHAFQ
jgi:hypothetical protein